MQRCLTTALALTVLLSALPASAAPAPPARGWRPPFWMMPWGIASADGARAYVVGQSGKVEALDLATGKVLWTFEAGKPLALVGRRLAVQVAVKDKPNTLHVVLLNEAGKQVGQSQPVVFPEGVEVSGDVRAFTSSAWSDGVHLYLDWRAGGRPTRGGRAHEGEAVHAAEALPEAGRSPAPEAAWGRAPGAWRRSPLRAARWRCWRRTRPRSRRCRKYPRRSCVRRGRPP